jgi:biopolymer transport protein ExbB
MIYEFFANSFNTILEMFKSGGVITYIITIIGIYGIFYSVEKINYLRKISQVELPQNMGEVNKAMDEEDP